MNKKTQAATIRMPVSLYEKIRTLAYLRKIISINDLAIRALEKEVARIERGG